MYRKLQEFHSFCCTGIKHSDSCDTYLTEKSNLKFEDCQLSELFMNLDWKQYQETQSNNSNFSVLEIRTIKGQCHFCVLLF